MWEVWATRLLNVGTVVVLGYFVLFIDYSGHGRLWDKVAAYLPGMASTSRGLPAPQRVTLAAAENGASRSLIAAEKAAPEPARAPSPPPIAPEEAAPTQAAPVPHLTSTLRTISTYDANARTSASAGSSFSGSSYQQAAPAASPMPMAGSTSGAAPARKLAAQASYGAASRTEVMGQAAGPVYNFTGNKKR